MSRHERPSPELQECRVHRGHCGQTGALVWFNEYFARDLDTEWLSRTCWSIPWEERHWKHPGLAVQGKESVLHLTWMSDVNMKDSSNDPAVLPIVSAFHFTSMSLCFFLFSLSLLFKESTCLGLRHWQGEWRLYFSHAFESYCQVAFGRSSSRSKPHSLDFLYELDLLHLLCAG